MKSPFAIIAAVDADFGIGKNGALPWQLSADLKHFKTVTTTSAPNKKNVVIMGRKTWESLPAQFRPLPGRKNVVLSRQMSYQVPQEVHIVKAEDLETMLNNLHKVPFKDVDKFFVIGGAEIFRRAIVLPACTKLYLTHLSKSFACDCFFPKEHLSLFRQTQKSPPARENSIEYFFAEYDRI